MFIVFEGIDRSGKSTQARLLSEHLAHKGFTCTQLRYPDRTSPITGSLIHDYLQGGNSTLNPQAASLILAANLWEMAARLKEAIAATDFVIMDRYVLSNIAYSATRGMSPDAFEMICNGLPPPDYTIFCDISAEDVCSRAGFGAERFEKLDFQQAVYKNFLNLLGREIPSLCGHLIKVDAKLDAQQLHQSILAHIGC